MTTTPTDKPTHCQAPCDPPCMRPVVCQGLCNGHFNRKRRGQRLDTPIGVGHGSDINKGAPAMTEDKQLEEEEAADIEAEETEDEEEETEDEEEEETEDEEEETEDEEEETEDEEEEAPRPATGRTVINIFTLDPGEAIRALRDAGVI